MKQNKQVKRKIGVIVFLVIIFITTYINMRGSFLEYKELGENFLSVFTTNLKYRYTIMGISFIIIYLVMYLTNRGIIKGLKVFFDEEKITMPKLPNKSISLIVATIASIIISEKFTTIGSMPHSLNNFILSVSVINSPGEFFFNTFCGCSLNKSTLAFPLVATAFSITFL